MLPRELTLLDDDDQVYDNYVENTTDPGSTLLLIAIVVCACSLASLPLSVALGKRYLKGHIREEDDDDNSDSSSSSSSTENEVDDQPTALLQRPRRVYTSLLHFFVDALVRWRANRSEQHVSHGIVREGRASLSNIPHNITFDSDGNTETALQLAPYNSQQLRDMRKVNCSCKTLKYMCTLAKCDNESKRILRLAVPFMISNMAKTLGALLSLAFISQNLGTDAMVAFAMVEVIVGTSSSFLNGWIEAISSLGSQAYGAENYELLGQYVQVSFMVYTACQIPIACVWGFSMKSIILLFGFNQATADIASNFVWVWVAYDLMESLYVGFLDFLEVIGKETYTMIFYCTMAACEVGLVYLFATLTDANLVVIGLVMVTNKCLFVFLTILISTLTNWTKPYEFGLIGEFGWKNREATRAIFRTALPLAFGGLLAYAEWEVLTVFAAFLGPAEAATWAILGFVWDVFESTTEAIGDASEIRCAYQLGKGRPEMAKISAYKSMLLGLVVSIMITITFLLLSDHLPSWLTKDPTIQDMLTELFPLVGLGNVTMTVGMVCWALIGAQGRYRLATSINMACSLLITVPLGAITTIWLRINLQGLTFSVICGYVICGLVLTVFLLLSDWEKLAEKIRERVANGELEIESFSDDSSSSSSSSSSASEKSCETEQNLYDGTKLDIDEGKEVRIELAARYKKNESELSA